jgi:hypothetical protein
MSRFILSLMIPLILAAAPAQETVPMTPERWQTSDQAEFVTYEGQPAIRLGAAPGEPLGAGSAVARDILFSTGVIEFDMLLHGPRDFPGLVFRSQPGGEDYESFYVRPHQNGNPDATQYTPVVNGDAAWQIFTGEGYTAQTRFAIGRWIHVRADIHPASASVSIDGEPVLIIPHLEGDHRSGGLGFNARGGTLFANLAIRPIAEYPDPRPRPDPLPLSPGTVAAWQVSAPLAEADAFARAAGQDWAGIEWHRLPVERHGIANLSKVGPVSEERHSFIARFGLASEAAQTVAMQFGFSDSVRVFLNGTPLYAGSDRIGSRDYRFLGIVGFWDELFLPLRQGSNEVAFVVSDFTSTGTAAAARLTDMSSLTIE